MRTYYIFKINKLMNPYYEKKTASIYKILEKISNFNKKEYLLANKIYKRVVVPLDKNKIDNYILMNHINDIYYTKNNKVHELYSSKEDSKLIICNTYIKIITTNNISTFFKDICSLSNDFFVIDFKNKDYFYIDEFRINVLA